jgi:hypothetical protein
MFQHEVSRSEGEMNSKAQTNKGVGKAIRVLRSWRLKRDMGKKGRNEVPIILIGHALVQGGSNMTGTQYGLFTHKSVPVIFESPCSNSVLR